MTFDNLSDLQKLVYKERVKAIKKFQKKYKTKEAKEEALKKMSNADINYCSDTIYANIFYSQFLKKSKEWQLTKNFAFKFLTNKLINATMKLQWKGKVPKDIYSSELGIVRTNNKYLAKEHPGANYRKE